MPSNMCHLITNRTGIHIIDPGWDLPQNTDRLLAVIESVMASVGPHRVPVVSVIATHPHRDHAGLLGALRERCVLSIGDGTASAYPTVDGLHHDLENWSVTDARREKLLKAHPGHDRDHVVPVDRDRRAIFTGDLVLSTVHPAIGITRPGNPVRGY